ncbi:unnamed protein product [Diplocarpon coronariae]
MNNVNMGGMNAMGGGPVGGGIPMMNNGAGGPVRQPMPPPNADQRSQLNTYIYEYFLRNNMYDCARSLLNSEQPINVEKDSPRRNGATDEGGDGDSKDDIDSKQPLDLPNPALPKECPESCFLYEWWCLFWDMFNAQRGKGDGRSVMQYVSHTQGQSRMRQEQQQVMLRGLRQGEMTQQQQQYAQQMMMRGNANGMTVNQQNELRHKAIQNNNRNAPPSQMEMLAQQKRQQQQQQQMQRDPSDQNNQQRPQSPGSAENAPSPSKRPRLDGAPFNPQQMPNGRGQAAGMPQQVGDTGPSNSNPVAHLQLANGVEPSNLTGQQFQNMPANANTQARLAGYQANLAQQQAGQMPVSKPVPNPGGPQNQGSPMMNQGQGGEQIANYYNPGDPNRMQGGPGGQPGSSGGNHALQDYQMQLMLLEQQNKKRLMMARAEQDNMMPRTEGPGGAPGPVGPNGQPFQQGTPPQGPRSVNSPNPGDQMKRGTPHMNNAGMPSPLTEGQSRGSPSGGMNFNLAGGQMDPSMNPQYYKMNGMDPNMVQGMPNGMRPPSSHPGGGFNQPMNQQQMAMARQNQQWQAGPNGGQMIPQQVQGGAPQQMGTPQQRAMPPPSAPAANAATNGRTQPPSPQQNAAPPTPSQANKANPKKKTETKDPKAKRPMKKGSTANLTAGATPSADGDTAATPTPATPITPVHPKSFTGQTGQNGALPTANGQPPAPPANPNVVQQPDALQGGSGLDFNNNFDFTNSMDFAAAGNGNMDVLQDFDFDSFLHQDGEDVNNFTFDSTAFLDGNEIGAD